jgi:hypothetical protein
MRRASNAAPRAGSGCRRLLAGLALLVAISLHALTRDAEASDARLTSRFAPQTVAEIERLAEEARSLGLPADRIVNVALEGANRRIPPERVIEAARRQLASLRTARTSLGATASESELVAAAGLLLAGYPADSLAALRAVRHGKPLVVPFVVMADFLVRGVPVAMTHASVMDAMRAGASDASLMRLRERVERDVTSGLPPSLSASERSRALVVQLRTPGGLDRSPTPSSPTGDTKKGRIP